MSRKKIKTDIAIHGRINPDETRYIPPDLEFMLDSYKPLIPSEIANFEAYATKGRITSYSLRYVSRSPGIPTGNYSLEVIGRGEQRRLRQKRREPIRVDTSYIKNAEETRKELDKKLREI